MTSSPDAAAPAVNSTTEGSAPEAPTSDATPEADAPVSPTPAEVTLEAPVVAEPAVAPAVDPAEEARQSRIAELEEKRAHLRKQTLTTSNCNAVLAIESELAALKGE